jgi:GDP-4-dehydro-6-deoxy-D-mannose reductase
VLDLVAQGGSQCRVIVPGSAAEYGRVSAPDLPLRETHLPNPVTAYGVAKVWQTTAVRHFASKGVDCVIGRIFNILGPGIPETLSIGAFATQLRRISAGELEPEILVGNLKPRRDFVDIKDVCSALLALAELGASGEIYNICSGASVSMEQILSALIQRSGVDVRVTIDERRIKRADIDDIYGSNEKIRHQTGWTPQAAIAQSIASIIDGP